MNDVETAINAEGGASNAAPFAAKIQRQFL